MYSVKFYNMINERMKQNAICFKWFMIGASVATIVELYFLNL